VQNIIKIDRHTILLTHQEKILFPNVHVSKGELIDYYGAIAPYMLPHMRGTLMSMQRFPQGITHKGFFYKNVPDYFPSWIKRACLEKRTQEGATCYVVGDTAATLIYLTNYDAIVFHTSLSRVDKIMYPDRMIFDLDPAPGIPFATIVWTAFELKKILEHVDLVPFALLTGSRGIHVVVPLVRCQEFRVIEKFAFLVGRSLVAQYPDRLTVEFSKKKRGRRIFIDTLRNRYGASSVAPYSVRALPRAPVAVPVSWERLSTVSSSDFLTIKTAIVHAEQEGHCWLNMRKSASALSHKKVNSLKMF